MRLIKGKLKTTYDNNVIGDLGNFSGLYSLKDFTNMTKVLYSFIYRWGWNKIKASSNDG